MRSLIALLCVLSVWTAGGVAQTKSSKAAKASKSNGTAATSSSPFTPECSLPFIATPGLKIDQTCGVFGNAAGKTPEGLQNHAKNNFCAPGPAVTVTLAILLNLQRASESASVSFGSESQLPTNRATLQKGFSIAGTTYHEGQRVQLAASLIETHPADLSSGESVNCGTKEDPKGNDVHMALGAAYGADECTSVTTELSPHSRPSAWQILADIAAKDKTEKPAVITQFPIRVTGQLFFDASHKLCSNGSEVPGNPARQSAWEIHPVYQVDVCSRQTLADCQADDAVVWTPIGQWKPPAGN